MKRLCVFLVTLWATAAAVASTQYCADVSNVWYTSNYGDAIKWTVVQNNAQSPPTLTVTMHNWGGPTCPDVTSVSPSKYTNQATGEFVVTFSILATYNPYCNPVPAPGPEIWTFSGTMPSAGTNACTEMNANLTCNDNCGTSYFTWDTCDGSGQFGSAHCGPSHNQCLVPKGAPTAGEASTVPLHWNVAGGHPAAALFTVTLNGNDAAEGSHYNWAGRYAWEIPTATGYPRDCQPAHFVPPITNGDGAPPLLFTTSTFNVTDGANVIVDQVGSENPNSWFYGLERVSGPAPCGVESNPMDISMDCPSSSGQLIKYESVTAGTGVSYQLPLINSTAINASRDNHPMSTNYGWTGQQYLTCALGSLCGLGELFVNWAQNLK